VPLDVVAGVRESGTCLSEAGPTVEIYLQVHPRDPHRFVNVIVFEEYLSKEWMSEWESSVDEMHFQLKGPKKYLRVSANMSLFSKRGEDADEDMDEDPTALMTFGRGKTLHAHETDPNMSPYEEGILRMTTKVHAVVDEVLRWAILEKLRNGSDVKKSLEGGNQRKRGRKQKGRQHTKQSKRVPITRGTRGRATRAARTSLASDEAIEDPDPTVVGGGLDIGGAVGEVADTSADDVVFEYPVAGVGELPLDSPDAVASHVSLNAPYDHHSDTRRIKPCNHYDAWRWSHESQMRILTHCMARSSEGANIKVPKRVVSIR